VNPYNDDVPYDFPMPYNGISPTPETPTGGGSPGAIDRRKKQYNMAAIYTALEYYDDEPG
jgi:hypothetical protein